MGPMTTLLLIGTKKGLWVATSEDRRTWDLRGPEFAMEAVSACAVDVRGDTPRLLVGSLSQHWGPTVSWSDDLGATWTDTPGGGVRFPEAAGASVEALWQLAPDTADRPGVVWAGTQPSALWRSDDGGETYALVEGLWDHPHRPTWAPGFGGQAVHTVLPDPVDDDRVLVAMSTGGVYVTEDRGVSWSPSNTGIHAWFFPDTLPEYGQCVHKVARDAGDADTLYAQNHGGVYVSRDRGASWTASAKGLPADFGFPVVAHPHRTGTAFVVPLVADGDRRPPGAQLQVWRTDDAGASWRATATGLPEDFYAVVLRDAFTADTDDPVGLYLGGRDGTVYVSADEGESWSQVAKHLPDVLCVRAATV
jgi:hypothetical protein